MSTVFQAPGQFYKGNIHGHSTHSDGKFTPEQVVEAYMAKGYDFISLTDHLMPEAFYTARRANWTPAVTDTTSLRSSDFTTIPGAEIHTPALVNGDLWHLVAVGLPLDFAVAGPEEDGLALAKRAYETGAFVGIAHPSWYTLTIAETIPLLPYAHAIEVWNTASSFSGRHEAWPFADELLTGGHRVHAYAADDSHYIDNVGAYKDAFGGWIQVKSESLDPDSLLAAIKAGNYYSSTGPEIEDLTFDGEKLTIRSSPVDRYYVSGMGARSQNINGGNLTEAEFNVDPKAWSGLPWGDYLRVTAIDADGNAAWSQPIWLNAGQ